MIKNIISVIKDKNENNIKMKGNELLSFLNPHSYKVARKNLEIFNELDCINIDGFSLVKLLNVFRVGRFVRKSFDMSSIAKDVLVQAEKLGKKTFFVGTTPENIEKASHIIQLNYPKLNVVGYRNGYFINEKEYSESYNKIIGLDSSLVIVGMGTPLQEKFIIGLKENGYKGTAYTCGGFFHQIINGIEYFPAWCNKYNLRWLYRIFKEPRVNLKRNTIGFIQFIFIFLYDVIYYYLNKK